MHLRFFATIREYTREQQREWTEQAGTLRELLNCLAIHYGGRFARAVLEKGELSPTIIILVNGRDIRHQGGLELALQPGDVISIFPMVAGG